MSFGDTAIPHTWYEVTFAAQSAGTQSETCKGVQVGDAVIVTSQTAADGVVVVDSVSADTVLLRNASTEAVDLTVTLLAFHKRK